MKEFFRWLKHKLFCWNYNLIFQCSVYFDLEEYKKNIPHKKRIYAEKYICDKCGIDIYKNIEKGGIKK